MERPYFYGASSKAGCGMKRCVKCGDEKPLDQFYRLHRSKDGRQYRCKDCQREDNRKYEPRLYSRYKEKRKAYYLQKGGFQGHLAEHTDDNDRKKEFRRQVNDLGVPALSAVPVLRLRPRLEKLLVAILSVGGCATRDDLRRQGLYGCCDNSRINIDIYWLRKSLQNTGFTIESRGYGLGYKFARVLA